MPTWISDDAGRGALDTCAEKRSRSLFFVITSEKGVLHALVASLCVKKNVFLHETSPSVLRASRKRHVGSVGGGGGGCWPFELETRSSVALWLINKAINGLNARRGGRPAKSLLIHLARASSSGAFKTRRLKKKITLPERMPRSSPLSSDRRCGNVIPSRQRIHYRSVTNFSRLTSEGWPVSLVTASFMRRGSVEENNFILKIARFSTPASNNNTDRLGETT